MKASAHNYYVPYNDGTIFMNGITEATFWVDDKHTQSLKQIIANPDSFPECEKFLKKLATQGFIIPDDMDESAAIKAKYEMFRMPEEYRIMILPTYQCNLRCWYCVQEHENSWLTDEHIERIKKLIIKKIDNPEIKRLNISWFGGEPLLAYDKLIELTRFAQVLTKEKGLTFYCGITSNATLLTPERIDELHDAGVNFYQITIDGEKTDHDKVKQLGKLSAFDTSLANIAHLARHTHCTLRFNYTKETLKPEAIIRQIDERIPREVRHNINFNLQPVWQTEKTDSIKIEDIITFMTMAHDIGLTPSLKPVGLCYVDHKHFDCVYPSCVAGKCDNGIEGMKHGILQQNGDVNYDNAETEHYKPTFELANVECSQCNYLPLCWGPCSQKRYLQLKKDGHIHCVWPDRHATVSEMIIHKHITDIFK